MAPLSLLGTVVRDKMMKTVTVQVISPLSVFLAPLPSHERCVGQIIILLVAVVVRSSSIWQMRTVLICKLTHTLVGVSSLSTLTRVPQVLRNVVHPLYKRTQARASCHCYSTNTAHNLPCSCEA